MKLYSVLRLGLVLLALGTGLIACQQPVVKPAPQETAQSAMQAAKDAYQRQDFNKAAEWFRKAADQGNTVAKGFLKILGTN